MLVLTLTVCLIYRWKLFLVMLGRYGDGGISVFSTNVSPQVFVKKSVSLLAFLGSFNTAGRLTVEEYTVHFTASSADESVGDDGFEEDESGMSLASVGNITA